MQMISSYTSFGQNRISGLISICSYERNRLILKTASEKVLKRVDIFCCILHLISTVIAFSSFSICMASIKSLASRYSSRCCMYIRRYDTWGSTLHPFYISSRAGVRYSPTSFCFARLSLNTDWLNFLQIKGTLNRTLWEALRRQFLWRYLISVKIYITVNDNFVHLKPVFQFSCDVLHDIFAPRNQIIVSNPGRKCLHRSLWFPQIVRLTAIRYMLKIYRT